MKIIQEMVEIKLLLLLFQFGFKKHYTLNELKLTDLMFSRPATNIVQRHILHNFLYHKPIPFVVIF